MSRFGEFLEYVQLYENGGLWQDHTYKNYDLLWRASPQRLRTALAECGFRNGELSVSLAECAARVRERGFAALSSTAVQQCLLEWYVWRRIEAGEYRKWKWNDQTTN